MIGLWHPPKKDQGRIKALVQGEHCQIHAYCVMDNHFHQSVTYLNGSGRLSQFMRYAHGLFGARFNRNKGRSGKVAEGRPKTPRVQNDYHAMRLHFYVYGIRTQFTERLTIPSWYLALGKTLRECQRKYRKLFRQYIEAELENLKGIFLKRAIGDALWVEGFLQELKDKLISLNKHHADTTNLTSSG